MYRDSFMRRNGGSRLCQGRRYLGRQVSTLYLYPSLGFLPLSCTHLTLPTLPTQPQALGTVTVQPQATYFPIVYTSSARAHARTHGRLRCCYLLSLAMTVVQQPHQRFQPGRPGFCRVTIPYHKKSQPNQLHTKLGGKVKPKQSRAEQSRETRTEPDQISKQKRNKRGNLLLLPSRLEGFFYFLVTTGLGTLEGSYICHNDNNNTSHDMA